MSTRACAVSGLLSLLLLGAAVSAGSLGAQAGAASAPETNGSAYGIIPKPAKLSLQSGEFLIDASTKVYAESRYSDVTRRFLREISAPLGFMPELVVASSPGASSARTAIQPQAGIHIRHRASLAAEAYTLNVAPSRVLIEASSESGVFYAFQTLRQMLPADIYRRSAIAGNSWVLPAVSIEDAPRFSWRGAHLDVSRHFMPKEFVLKYIDLLALHKLNRFHWHLTDDQGWRIEILKYPRLTEVGSCRDGTLVGRYVTDPAKQVFDGLRHCGYYTQDDIREVVAYAAQRMITVVPEIEMPGHAQAAITAYPYLSSRPDTNPGVWRLWGVSPFILNPSDTSVAFMQDVLREVLELFPSPWIHVGGDEAAKDQWQASPPIQARIRSLGLRNEHEMQSWFIGKMDSFLSANGRRLIGWDEILEGGLALGATVMSWRGMDGGIAAARAGHDVVMAPVGYTYLDYYQSRDQASEPLAIGGFTPLDSVYALEPVPASLTEAEAAHVLGAQAQLWTEYIPGPKQAEYMVFPRLSALSEVVWSSKRQRNFADFMQRLQVHMKRLDVLDVNYRRS